MQLEGGERRRDKCGQGRKMIDHDGQGILKDSPMIREFAGTGLITA